MAVTAISVNVNGLRYRFRCRTILDNLSKRNFDFAFLKETHLDDNTIYKITNNWKGNSYHSYGTYNSAGVTILTKHKISDPYINRDCKGNYIIARFSLDGQRYLLINVYAPSGGSKQEERKAFFQKLTDTIPQPDRNELVIFGGDLNMTIEKEDREPQRGQNCKSKPTLLTLIQKLHI